MKEKTEEAVKVDTSRSKMPLVHSFSNIDELAASIVD